MQTKPIRARRCTFFGFSASAGGGGVVAVGRGGGALGFAASSSVI
jgi:hypothetical protein